MRQLLADNPRLRPGSGPGPGGGGSRGGGGDATAAGIVQGRGWGALRGLGFFEAMDWDALAAQTLTPPFTPVMPKGEGEVLHFFSSSAAAAAAPTPRVQANKLELA